MSCDPRQYYIDISLGCVLVMKPLVYVDVLHTHHVQYCFALDRLDFYLCMVFCVL